MTKIIIQGAGVVGQSTELFLKKFVPGVDIAFNDPGKDIHASKEEWTDADYVVVCVSTNLQSDLTPPENSTVNLDAAINKALTKGFRGTFIIRSTVGMGVIKQLAEQLGQHLLVWPEYIREATWAEDAVSPRFITLGGEGAEAFANLITDYAGAVFITDPMEAMIAKLSTNTFLAMKVIFANQVSQLCSATGADYELVKVLLESEGRLGSSHWTVPGADGLGGFSGKCFPKDVKTFEAALIKAGIHVDLIRSISDLNDDLRSK